MFLDPITAPEIDIRKAFSPTGRIWKSRQRQCPPHLVSLPMVDSLGRHTTYCVKPPPPEMLHDPFYAAKRDIAGTTHLARIPGLAQHHVIAIGGAIPDRTTLGEKITRYRHPLQHLGDDVHIIEKHPDSDALGHTPPQAYQYAVGKLLVRGQAGEPYGIGEVTARDAQGKPTRYRLHRDRKYTFTGRISAADRKDHPRGSGVDLAAAQFEYLQQHPPEVSVETTPSGEVFATHSKMLFPPVDADGHPIAGRPLEARHEIKLHPVVYGGEQAFRALGLTPHRKFEGSEKDAGRAFLTYLEQARRKFFAREADRAPSGSVDELLRQHNGNVDQLVMSGDLGHENVALPPTERRKQHWVGAKKPIGEREIDQLVLHWRAQHPALIDSIKAEVARQHPVLRGDAAIDNAIDAGIANAIHRYDPKRGDFARFARQTAVGQAFDEARARRRLRRRGVPRGREAHRTVRARGHGGGSARGGRGR